jgi:ariadne-1
MSQPETNLIRGNELAWKAVVGDEGLLQTLWERENTRSCPRCKRRIEKNGGCNHMQCNQCNYEFCWICGHEWNSHTVNSSACANAANWDDKFAGVPKPSEKRMAEAQKAAMFITRYRAHEHSQTNQQRRRETTINDLVDRLMRDNLPGDQAVDFALTVFGATEVTSSVLLWSYPCALCMANGPELRIFQHL